MTVKEAGTSVRASVLIVAPIDRAFKVFTEEISTWWPPDHHIIDGELAGIVFEPRVGGYVYDRTTDGRECRWARVLAYEPPTAWCSAGTSATCGRSKATTTKPARSK
jgi:uncharacterized protein YndB with AHSA1/START domain